MTSPSEPDLLHPSESASPHPRRYWWLTRLSAVYALLIAAVIGVRWWWGDHSSRRLNAAIDAAHARGERILVGDYARSEFLPDDQNLATYLRRAEKATAKLTKTQEWALSNAAVLPLREDLFQNIGRALAENPQVVAELRAARGVRQADWGLNVVSPMWSVLLPHLNPMRQLANISRAAALHASQRGDHAEAVEHVLDMSPLIRSLDDQPFLVTHLVRIGIAALAADTAGEIALDLQIAGPNGEPPSLPTTQPATRPARREHVRALIAALLEDDGRRAAFQEALRGERAAQADVGISMSQRARLVRPAIQLDTLQLIKESDQLVAAAAAPNFPEARKRLPALPVVTGPRVVVHMVSQSTRPALNRAYSTAHRGVAQSRMAAVALAIRMYQHDHAGQRPPTLAALVPDYLPAVPLDPMAPAGTPIGYMPDGAAPYVYSVGENGGDDSAGAPNVPPWRPDAKSDPYKSPDLFLPLTRALAREPEIEDPPVEEDDAPTSPPAQ